MNHIHQTSPSTSSIKCLQINLRHSRLAALHLSQTLLDLDIDVAFIQEPYATSNPNITIKYVPEHYAQLHSLLSDHAYGAAILAKRCLNPTLFPGVFSHCAVGAEITFHHKKLYLFSLYFWPSINNLQSFFLNLSASVTPQIARRSILCIDSNAMNPLWNSRTLDEKGRDTEDFCRAQGLNIANFGLRHLSHTPQNTSFPDITLAGDYVIVSRLKFLDLQSLSDHPYINFALNNTDIHPIQTPRILKWFQRLSACSTDNFISL